MARSVRIKLNRAALRQLLRGPEVQADLAARANRIASAAGGAPGYEAEVYVGPNRARGDVATETWPARYAEATDRTLSRALDAGR